MVRSGSDHCAWWAYHTVIMDSRSDSSVWHLLTLGTY